MKINFLLNANLVQACEKFHVKALYVFGSVITEDFSSISDLDFLVEFAETEDYGAFDQFMEFKETLSTFINGMLIC